MFSWRLLNYTHRVCHIFCELLDVVRFITVVKVLDIYTRVLWYSFHNSLHLSSFNFLQGERKTKRHL